VTDAMHWTPDPPERPEPLLRIDLTGFARDMDAARPYLESLVESYAVMVRDAWNQSLAASGFDTPTDPT
jgi:hypothetical protein